MPKRIQLSRASGWRLPKGAVKVDRSTNYGNPYCVGKPVDMKIVRRWGWNFSPEGQKLVCADASEAVVRFEYCLQWDEAIHGWVREKLGGKDLACWCALDELCHADVLLRIANADPAVLRSQNAAADERMIESSRRAIPSHERNEG
jgi:hypothetical protein